MWQMQQQKRTRRTVEHELTEATTRRAHAISTLDLDAYTNLTEQLDDLIEELRGWALAHP